MSFLKNHSGEIYTGLRSSCQHVNVHEMGRMCSTSITDGGSYSKSGCGKLLQVRLSVLNILGSRLQFWLKLFAALCDALQVHKSMTTPYTPSVNGQAERYNKSLMDAIRCFTGKSQNRWHLNLQQIAGAIRSSVNRSNGYTTNRLMFRKPPSSPQVPPSCDQNNGREWLRCQSHE